MNAVSKWLTALMFGPMAANAALISTDAGLGVYDTTYNVTWTSDANLMATQAATYTDGSCGAAGSSTCTSAFVSAVISASGGVIHDIPNALDTAPNSGTYTLSASDFYVNGLMVGAMTWWGAQAWVHYLDVTNYGGSNQWALPTTMDSDFSVGYPVSVSGRPSQSSSQMAELFYGSLGQEPDDNITDTHSSSYALFINLVDGEYRSGTELSVFPSNDWIFDTSYGEQLNIIAKNVPAFALAVAPGKVNAPVALLAALLKEATGVGPGKSLADKVTAAQTYYAVPDIQATCAVLTGFVHEVQAQNGKKIDPALDAKLIADANAIEVAIGCN